MVSASIVTYNHPYSEIQPAVESLLASVVSDIYIIDHSEDKSILGNDINAVISEAERLGKRMYYIEHENLGYGSGHNVALRKALENNADYHIVVNPDVWFDGNIIGEIEQYLNNHSDVGQLMPLVLYPNGEVQRVCKLLPDPITLFGRLATPRLVHERNKRFELCMTDYHTSLNVPYLSGCFMYFRMDAIREVGLFDEHFFMYAEDIDMTRRIHQRYTTLYYPEVAIYHKFSRASRHSLKMFYIHMKNIIMYFNKWGWFFDKERDAVNKRLLDEIA